VYYPVLRDWQYNLVSHKAVICILWNSVSWCSISSGTELTAAESCHHWIQAYIPACALMPEWMEFCLQFTLIPSFPPCTAVTFPYPIPPFVSPSSEPFEYCMTRKRSIFNEVLQLVDDHVIRAIASVIKNLYYYTSSSSSSSSTSVAPTWSIGHPCNALLQFSFL
jgi:hypothetical protein